MMKSYCKIEMSLKWMENIKSLCTRVEVVIMKKLNVLTLSDQAFSNVNERYRSEARHDQTGGEFAMMKKTLKSKKNSLKRKNLGFSNFGHFQCSCSIPEKSMRGIRIYLNKSHSIPIKHKKVTFFYFLFEKPRFFYFLFSSM